MENMQFLQFFVGKFEQQIYNSVHKPACFNQIVSIYPTEVAFLVSFFVNQSAKFVTIYGFFLGCCIKLCMILLDILQLWRWQWNPDATYYYSFCQFWEVQLDIFHSGILSFLRSGISLFNSYLWSCCDYEDVLTLGLATQTEKQRDWKQRVSKSCWRNTFKKAQSHASSSVNSICCFASSLILLWCSVYCNKILKIEKLKRQTGTGK